MQHIVFYCWQSDSPPATNRNLTHRALTKAIETANQQTSYSLELDQAQEDVRGLVNIPDHIREKLERYRVFARDLTLVGSVDNSEKR